MYVCMFVCYIFVYMSLLQVLEFYFYSQVAEMEKLWEETKGNPPRSAVRDLEIKFG